MKTRYLIIFIMLTGSTGVSQAQSVPRTEYTIQLSEPTLHLNPGETKSVTVRLNRSKNFSKYKAELTTYPALPDGLIARFEPATGLFDVSTLSISAAASSKPGQYQIIVRCDLGRKLKATVLTLYVTDVKADVVKNE
jgi:hypothetical protein